jgi:hypothetical protein
MHSADPHAWYGWNGAACEWKIESEPAIGLLLVHNAVLAKNDINVFHSSLECEWSTVTWSTVTWSTVKWSAGGWQKAFQSLPILHTPSLA